MPVNLPQYLVPFGGGGTAAVRRAAGSLGFVVRWMAAQLIDPPGGHEPAATHLAAHSPDPRHRHSSGDRTCVLRRRLRGDASECAGCRPLVAQLRRQAWGRQGVQCVLRTRVRSLIAVAHTDCPALAWG